ncbi:testis-expressed protein 44 [Acomys russatus]|uniref:testis-expressed protein 44 n=1 Tax=Acomys russatus TaxID=60746 RepID=UPI0021E2B755|nr:testis-expressed protein 44 [Acomys russatus]
MTTGPLEEAEANSKPVYNLPKAALGNEADENSADVPGKSQSLDFLPDDVQPVDNTTALTEQEDVDQTSVGLTIIAEEDEDQESFQSFTEQDEGPASAQMATFREQDGDQASVPMATSIRQDIESSISMAVSGDKDEIPDAPNQHQENLEEVTSLLPQASGTLQVFVGFQNPVWDRLAENNRTSRSRTVSPSNSQNQEKTPGNPEIAPNADVPSVLPENVQPSMGATGPSTLDTSSPGLEPTGTIKPAEQEAESFKALNPESKANPPWLTGEDLAADSRIPQTPPSPSNPPPSPDPCQVALNRNVLDPSLYRPVVDNDYMRSMTSLLGGGEGSISSLADILVWSDTATSMGLAMGILASGHSSPADRLQEEGPSLRTISSLLNNARSAFRSGLVVRTGSALRSVTHLLESVERRTMEGIRSALRYLANHFTPHWARPGSNGN